MKKALVYLVGIYTLCIFVELIVNLQFFILSAQEGVFFESLNQNLIANILLFFRGLLSVLFLWTLAFYSLLKNKKYALLLLVVSLTRSAPNSLDFIQSSGFERFDLAVLSSVNLIAILAIATLAFILWCRGELIFPTEESTKAINNP